MLRLAHLLHQPGKPYLCNTQGQRESTSLHISSDKYKCNWFSVPVEQCVTRPTPPTPTRTMRRMHQMARGACTFRAEEKWSVFVDNLFFSKTHRRYFEQLIILSRWCCRRGQEHGCAGKRDAWLFLFISEPPHNVRSSPLQRLPIAAMGSPPAHSSADIA